MDNEFTPWIFPIGLTEFTSHLVSLSKSFQHVSFRCLVRQLSVLYFQPANKNCSLVLFTLFVFHGSTIKSIVINKPFQPFFSALGCACAIIFACLGAAYGTAKSGVGITSSGILRPDLVIRSMSTQTLKVQA